MNSDTLRQLAFLLHLEARSLGVTTNPADIENFLLLANIFGTSIIPNKCIELGLYSGARDPKNQSIINIRVPEKNTRNGITGFISADYYPRMPNPVKEHVISILHDYFIITEKDPLQHDVKWVLELEPRYSLPVPTPILHPIDQATPPPTHPNQN